MNSGVGDRILRPLARVELLYDSQDHQADHEPDADILEQIVQFRSLRRFQKVTATLPSSALHRRRTASGEGSILSFSPVDTASFMPIACLPLATTAAPVGNSQAFADPWRPDTPRGSWSATPAACARKPSRNAPCERAPAAQRSLHPGNALTTRSPPGCSQVSGKFERQIAQVHRTRLVRGFHARKIGDEVGNHKVHPGARRAHFRAFSGLRPRESRPGRTARRESAPSAGDRSRRSTRRVPRARGAPASSCPAPPRDRRFSCPAG